MSDKKVGEAASFIPVWLCMWKNFLSWYLSSSRNDIVVKYFKWSLSWSVHIKGAIKTSGNFFSGAEICSCVRCLHNMYPTKIGCILFSAYISVSFYHKFSHNIGCILSKTLPITLTKFKWKLRVLKGFFFFGKKTSSRFGHGSFQFCSPNYWRLTNPRYNVAVSLVHFIHTSFQNLVVKPIKYLVEG